MKMVCSTLAHWLATKDIPRANVKLQLVFESEAAAREADRKWRWGCDQRDPEVLDAMFAGSIDELPRFAGIRFEFVGPTITTEVRR
jgi:hypothetical protein